MKGLLDVACTDNIQPGFFSTTDVNGCPDNSYYRPVLAFSDSFQE